MLYSLQSTSKIWNKSTLLQKVCYVLLVIITLMIVYRYLKVPKEGFNNTSKEFVIHKDKDIYDDFYANIYDSLMYNYGKINFEIGEITEIQKPTNESSLLDVGSGTGHHVNSFSQKGIKAIGVDSSQAMIDKAKENFPDNEFIKGDVTDTMLFTPNSFTHVTCLNFTIYYIKDKRRFFSNCMEWLLPGGFLIVHLVDRENFDPIIPAAKQIYIISPQKYADKRITNSVVKFNNFDYKCNYEFNDNITTINETFKNKENENIRKNEHKLYMEPQKSILSLAKEVGFIMHSKVDMIKCQYDNQYLYILQKPN